MGRVQSQSRAGSPAFLGAKAGARGWVARLALLLGMAAGCASEARLAALRQELAELRAGAAPLQSGGALDLRGAIHVHTQLSPDSEGRLADILEAATAAGLDYVALTDHAGPELLASSPSEAVAAGAAAGVLVIPGMEINGSCWNLADRCPSLLAVGLERYFDPEGRSWPEIIGEIRAQGGLPFVAHPRGWSEGAVEGLAGMEIYDILDDVLDRKWKLPGVFLDALRLFEDYPEELWLSLLDRPEWHLERWDAGWRERRSIGIAGNNAHQNVRLFGRQLDPYALSLRIVTTHVWAEARDARSVLAALDAGHAYVAFEILADATGFDFHALDGETRIRPGAELREGPARELQVLIPRPGRIVLLRDGEPIRSCQCSALIETVREPGSYRIEAYLRLADRWRLWILSNPIAIREAEGGAS